MKLITLKFKIIIGIVLFVVLVCSAYYEKYAIHIQTSNKSTNIETSNTKVEETKVQMGSIQYNGKFLTPVENFKVVTSKFGYRIHPVTR